MGVAEYFLGLMAIVSGLAVTDMVSSLHGLLRRFRKVRWDILPLSAAALVFVAILFGWFISWRSIWEGLPFYGFLVGILQLVALFLAAKAILPDDDGSESEVDLLAHYQKSNRYVWLAFLALHMFIIIASTAASARWGQLDQAPPRVADELVYIVIDLVLVLVQKMWLHRIIIPLLLIAHLLLWGGQVLTGRV